MCEKICDHVVAAGKRRPIVSGTLLPSIIITRNPEPLSDLEPCRRQMGVRQSLRVKKSEEL